MGTYKKYFTLSFDDGVTQDKRVIDMLNEFSLKCATFNINTGLFSANWKWVGEHFGRPDVTHIRFSEDEIKNGMYDGFEIAAHTLNHPSLKVYDDNDEMIKKEVGEDAENIYKLTGKHPIGMAWPGSDREYTDTTIEKVLKLTNIRYARATDRTASFEFPKYFMKWMPTCSLSDDDAMDIAKKFVDAEPTCDMLFYVWCHSYEFDIYNTWDRLYDLLKLISESEGITPLTNGEFYNIYKDTIPSWK